MTFDHGTGWYVDLPSGEQWWAARAKGWTREMVEEVVCTFLQFTPTDCCDECGEETTGKSVVCSHCYDMQLRENDRLMADLLEA